MAGASQSKLAIHGGPKVREGPWPPRGLVGDDERRAIEALFDESAASGKPIGYDGPSEQAYCREFAEWLGGGFADAVNSGTAAVYVALKALEPEPFSEVIVGAVTDPGGMMPIPLHNCIPLVADTEPGSLNTGPAQIAPLISPRTSGIVVAHIAGVPCDMPGICELADRHGIPVIEDCAQAHGATIDGRLVGTFGTVAAFSTMFGKHHCTGGQGGVVFTRDEALYAAIRRASDRGKPFGLPAGSTNAVASLNFNLNDLAAAIGRVQLRKLPGIVARRREIARAIGRGIDGLATVSLPALPDGMEPTYWFLRVRFHTEVASCDKATFCRALAAEGLPVTTDYDALPHTRDWFVHRRVFGRSGLPWTSPQYRGDADREFPTPHARRAVAAHFNIGMHEGWDDRAVADAVAVLAKVDAAYCRA